MLFCMSLILGVLSDRVFFSKTSKNQADNILSLRLIISALKSAKQQRVTLAPNILELDILRMNIPLQHGTCLSAQILEEAKKGVILHMLSLVSTNRPWSMLSHSEPLDHCNALCSGVETNSDDENMISPVHCSVTNLKKVSTPNLLYCHLVGCKSTRRTSITKMVREEERGVLILISVRSFFY